MIVIAPSQEASKLLIPRGIALESQMGCTSLSRNGQAHQSSNLYRPSRQMIPTLGHTVYTHGQILTLQSEKGVSEGGSRYSTWTPPSGLTGSSRQRISSCRTLTCLIRGRRQGGWRIQRNCHHISGLGLEGKPVSFRLAHKPSSTCEANDTFSSFNTARIH